jgi:hypothetical protein
VKRAVKVTAAQQRAKRIYQSKKRAAGLCLECKEPAAEGHVRCAAHLERIKRHNIAANYDRRHRDNTPTFEQFCRLEDER